MSIQPKGDDLRKAVRWIAERRQDDPEKRLSAIVEAASAKYDLSPKDESFLLRFILEKNVKTVD